MNKKFIFSFLIIGILILTVGTVSAGFFQDIFSSPTGNAIVEPGDIDTIPRISYWWGKVNQHTEKGVWKTDPDGRSGALLTLTKSGKINYCQKWYPETVDVEEYAEEYIIFYNAGNRGESPSVRTSYECVQPEGSEDENKSEEKQESYCDGDTCVIYEGSSVDWNGKKISIVFMDSERASFKVGTDTTGRIQEGWRGFADNVIIKVLDNLYKPYEGGISSVRIEVSYNSYFDNETLSCTDSDGGVDYYEKGYVSDPEHGGNYTDSCIGSTSEIREYYCGTNNYQYWDYDCPNGCSHGACIKDSETTNQTTPTTSNSEVTYQGVLDMLSDCSQRRYSLSSGSINGKEICEQSEETCIITFDGGHYKSVDGSAPVVKVESIGQTNEGQNCKYRWIPSSQVFTSDVDHMSIQAICCSPPN